MNLVRNSVEALENMEAEDGCLKRVQFNAWSADSATAVIEVADTGPGVPQAVREKLFTPFSSSRSGGSGLGLVIAADLVRGHGGDIMLVTPAGTGESGTTFRITLPQTAAAN